MVDEYFPRKGDVVGGAVDLLKAILDGKVNKYPDITLKIAGIEANATRDGYPQVKAILHKVVEAIREAVRQASLKRRGQGFENVEIPPEVRQQFLPVVQEAYNALLSMSGGNEVAMSS